MAAPGTPRSRRSARLRPGLAIEGAFVQLLSVYRHAHGREGVARDGPQGAQKEGYPPAELLRGSVHELDREPRDPCTRRVDEVQRPLLRIRCEEAHATGVDAARLTRGQRPDRLLEGPARAEAASEIPSTTPGAIALNQPCTASTCPQVGHVEAVQGWLGAIAPGVVDGISEHFDRRNRHAFAIDHARKCEQRESLSLRGVRRRGNQCSTRTRQPILPSPALPWRQCSHGMWRGQVDLMLIRVVYPRWQPIATSSDSSQRQRVGSFLAPVIGGLRKQPAGAYNLAD